MYPRITSAMAFIPIIAVTIALAIVFASEAPVPPSVGAGVERSASPTQIVAAPPAGTLSPVVPLPATAGAASASPVPALTDIQDLRIAVPRLGIDLPLALGVVERDVPRDGFAGATPEDVALVYPGSRAPGDGGNTYIYAHARSGMFLSLWNTAIGDRVVISDVRTSAVLAYRVGLIVPRVDPSDTHWLEPTGVERLTLQTSTGPRPTDPRFIVVAYPDAETPKSSSP
jgi:hypothetical protein